MGGWEHHRPPLPAAPVRYRPAPGREPRRRGVQRLQAALAAASALVMVVTGAAWGIYRDVTAGIRTTGAVAGGASGGAQDILLVGVDSRTDARGEPLPPEVLRTLHSGADTGVLNADTIILLHVPEGGGGAIAFSVPRDAYVTVPGQGRDKINSAYPGTKARVAEELVADGVRDPARVEAESAEAGRRTLVAAVERLTGVDVDHYAELNLLGFFTLTEAIGGVDVCLKAPVADELSGARFPAGRQRISGADALAFVRQRHGLPDGDLSRIRRQQVFLAAVADKILSGDTLTDPYALGALVDAAAQSLVIDEGWDLLALARQASGIAGGDVEFVTIPVRGPQTNARGDVMLVDRTEVREFVERRIAEAQARAEAAPTPVEPPPPVDVEAGRYVVHVRNASGDTGMAARVADRMRELGFVRGIVDNAAEPAAASVVRHSADAAGANAVAAQLGGLDVERDDALPPGHVHVLLGDDFDPAVLGPEPGVPTAAPLPDTGPITGDGVRCVD